MKFNTKGQIFILSGLFLIIVLIFTYSIETDNAYIVKTSKYNLLENIIYETCQIGKISSGPNIESRYISFENNIENYCISLDITCDLTITNNIVLPGDTSLINYTMFDYHIVYEDSDFSYETDFTC